MFRTSFLCVVLMAFVASFHSTAVGAAAPAFMKRKTEYTPLLFFKVPPGQMPECDDMEKIVSAMEKETGIKVQRLDIMRDRMARKLYEKIVEGNLRSPFPLLYHRESLQRVYGLADKDLVRSWSKGRLMPDMGAKDEKEMTVLGGDEEDMEGEEMDMEELEMQMDQELTPAQRRGKEAMKRRMEQGRK